MASRTSGLISQVNYIGSKRGRPISDNFGWDMFPEKTEITPIIEDNIFDQLNDDRRSTLKDFGPETSGLFPYEQARRNTYAVDRLNLRDGMARVTTDAYQNEGYDTQFHDKDPRGWSTEQPWSEYRKIVEKQFQHIDFKDDGDYSVPSSVMHPNTLYKRIRNSQDWLKARFKNFSEEYEGRSNGGVGVYSHVSGVYRSDAEDSINQFDDPEMSQHHNVNISNLVHLGSKFLRENSTTDHLVKVAAYGKLYKQRGLINHETQIRILEDDTPWGKLASNTQNTKHLARMMANQVYSDNANISPYTASEIGRILQQTDQIEPNKNPTHESMQSNRQQILTKDIMALLGVTSNEVKFLESYDGANKKQAKQTLADIYNMATTVHKMSANEKLLMFNELVLRSSSSGLKPGDVSSIRNNVIVNPKIINFMQMQTRKTKTPDDDFIKINYLQNVDPENKLDKNSLSLFVYKSNNPTDQTRIYHESQGSAIQRDTSKKTANYKNLTYRAPQYNLSNNDHVINVFSPFILGKKIQIGDTNIYKNKQSINIDNEFGENRYLNRHGGKIGNKNTRTKMVSDYKPNDDMSDLENFKNKYKSNV